MKKSIIWLMALMVVVGAVFGGCRKVKTPPRKLIVGFFAGETERSANTVSIAQAEQEERKVEVSDLMKKVYNGVCLGIAKEGQRAFAIATYEEDGKLYRYLHEPIEWSMVEGEEDLVVLEPNPYAAECWVWAAGGKVGKAKIMATAQSGYTDTADIYIVPDIKDSGSIAPIGLILDEELWMSYPGHPGLKAKVHWRNEDADIVFDREVVRFPHGATPLPDLLFGGWLLFDQIDWETPIEEETIEYPYNYSDIYLMLDGKGRKIAIYMNHSYRDPLRYIAWHAQDRE